MSDSERLLLIILTALACPLALPFLSIIEKGGQHMNKPLAEWTLAEVKAECEKYAVCSPECRAYNDKLERAIACRARFAPGAWDLSEPPRWTEQDKEDARKIKAIFPESFNLEVNRLEDGRLKLFVIQGLSFVLINDMLLPSLKPGEAATLD